MDQTKTPAELAKELGVDAKRIRKWLRAQGWQSIPNTRWHLTTDQADQVRGRFRE